MKKNVLLIMYACVVGFFSLNSTAQNLITDGNMENAAAWTIHQDEGNYFDPSYNFNFTTDVPAAGEGGCLFITGEINPAGADASINSFCFQEVTVMAGTTYSLTAAFKDVSSDDLYNFWCELGLSPYNIADSLAGGAHMMMAMNTWDGCGSGLDGTFQADECKYSDDGAGQYYKIPAEPAGEQTYFLFIQTGSWDNTSDVHYFDILVDEFVLMDSALVGSEPEAIEVVMSSENLYLSSYPNPATGSVAINYEIPDKGLVTLSVHNLLGEVIYSIEEEYYSAGSYEKVVDLRQFENGVYFISLKTSSSTGSHKIVISN